MVGDAHEQLCILRYQLPSSLASNVLGVPAPKNGVPMGIPMDPERVGHFEKMRRQGQPGSNETDIWLMGFPLTSMFTSKFQGSL